MRSSAAGFAFGVSLLNKLAVEYRKVDALIPFAQPLAGLSPVNRRAVYRSSGMHSPNADLRTDTDAFEIRNDVSVEDACLTSLRLVRMVVAQLDLLGTSADLDPAYRDVVDGIACLGRLACGTVGLVHAALCEQPVSE